jgi:LCP family protein required for cell wall assembly
VPRPRRFINQHRSRPRWPWLIVVATFLLVFASLYSVLRPWFTMASDIGRVLEPQQALPINSEGTPEPYPNWTSNEKFSVLLVGLDTRPGEPAHTDTLILVSVDPQNKVVGMLSIPRDLWVEIPGYGQERINAAYAIGEARSQGSGMQLLKATLARVLGVTVHYYAMVDYRGLVKVVDTIGGVTVDVNMPIKDDEFPTEDYGYTRIYIPAGLQHMDGTMAMQYARSRHADNDFGRSKRQQQILMAIRDQGVRLDLFPKLPTLISNLADTVRTDLNILQIGSLARLGLQIPKENVVQAAIDEHFTTPYTTPEGAAVLLPRMELIRPLVKVVTERPGLLKERASVQVQNGTDAQGLAARWAKSLQEAGFTVVGTAQAQQANDGPTYLLDFGDHPLTVAALKEVLGNVRVEKPTEPSTGVDIIVLLGRDAIGRNP